MEKLYNKLAIDLGNKNIRASYRGKIITMPSTIAFKEDKLLVGVCMSRYQCIFDFVSLLGMKYNDNSFKNKRKYSSYDYQMGRDQNIQIMLVEGVSKIINKKYFLLKSIILWMTETAQSTLTKRQIQQLQLIIILPNCISHLQTLAIYNSCKIINMIPYIIKSTNAIVTQFYWTKEQNHKLVAVIDYGDRYFSIGVYRLTNQNIIQCIDIQHTQLGGFSLTQLIIEHTLTKVMQDRGLDLRKNSDLMVQLIIQAQNAKIFLSRQSQAFIRIEDLPDQTQYGYIITLKQFINIASKIIDKNIQIIEKILSKYPKIKLFLISGGSADIPYFKKQLYKKLQYQKVKWVNKNQTIINISKLKQSKLIIFDLSPTTIELQPQQDNRIICIHAKDSIPVRHIQIMKFPPGNLEYILRIYQYQRKIAQYVITEPPQNYVFKLIFEINRNGLFNIYGSNDKGKIKIQEDQRGLKEQEIKIIANILENLEITYN